MPNRITPPLKLPCFIAVHTARFDGTPEFRDVLRGECLRTTVLHSGFLAAEHAYDPSGFGILVSYWTDQDAFEDWVATSAHQVRQQLGISEATSIFSHEVLRTGIVESEERHANTASIAPSSALTA